MFIGEIEGAGFRDFKGGVDEIFNKGGDLLVFFDDGY
jgi:hypothetical protein